MRRQVKAPTAGSSFPFRGFNKRLMKTSSVGPRALHSRRSPKEGRLWTPAGEIYGRPACRGPAASLSLSHVSFNRVVSFRQIRVSSAISPFAFGSFETQPRGPGLPRWLAALPRRRLRRWRAEVPRFLLDVQAGVLLLGLFSGGGPRPPNPLQSSPPCVSADPSLAGFISSPASLNSIHLKLADHGPRPATPRFCIGAETLEYFWGYTGQPRPQVLDVPLSALLQTEHSSCNERPWDTGHRQRPPALPPAPTAAGLLMPQPRSGALCPSAARSAPLCPPWCLRLSLSIIFVPCLRRLLLGSCCPLPPHVTVGSWGSSFSVAAWGWRRDAPASVLGCFQHVHERPRSCLW